MDKQENSRDYSGGNENRVGIEENHTHISRLVYADIEAQKRKNVNLHFACRRARSVIY